eukprot:TRINITY_DN6886_c0_g1_i1.p1 TRINITY_DN6886_c0_g1~~TRINITY_DN6886_c0_g1_i1.p1  ORF type:complete len:511 (+),score=103.35 TRINITY_DN6886_c0_g1_i1:115-1647(+)
MRKTLQTLFSIGFFCAWVECTPSLAEYMKKREQFLEEQESYRMDAGERVLVGGEVQLNETVVKLRDKLRVNQSDTVAIPLRGVKEEIERTDLFKILHEMPKATILHVHWSSTVSIQWLIANGTYFPNCYIYWPSTDVNLTALRGQGRYYPPSTAPPGWVLASTLRQQIPNFDDILYTQYWDVYHNDTTPNERVDPWGPFADFFTLTGGVLSYRPVFESYMKETIRQAVEDWKVNFLELRGFGYDSGTYDLTKQYSSLESTNILINISNHMKSAYGGRWLGMRTIVSEYRGNPPDVIQKSLEQAVFIKKNCADKEFVIGWDLVGQEDSGLPLRSFLPQLLNYSNELDYFFHAGETDLIGNGTTSDNVNDAVLLGAKRIGHGLAAAKLPLAAKVLKERGITLEVCPVSNQGLQFVLDARQHPASSLFDAGIPITINNDDPAILATTNSMGYDWYLAVMSWDIDLASMKAMVIQAIQASSITDDTKTALYNQWKSEWDRWVAAMNAAYPPSTP